MKFIYIQDGHLKGKNSVHRKGDYFLDWLQKFDEVIAIAKNNKADAILDGGDLFDSAVVSYSVCDAIIDRIEKSKLKYYSLFGNHAERYHSVEHSFDTTLAHVFRRSKNFKYLTCIEDEDSCIRGIEYTHTIEDDLKHGVYFNKASDNKWCIAIIHAFICSEKFPFASHILCDDIPTDADLILVAHYHKQWQKQINNTLFLDIGCFGRNSITEANIRPSCLLLDTKNRTYEQIYLTCAKDGQNIFDFTKKEYEASFDTNIQRFIQSLESTTFQAMSIEGIIKEMAKNQNIDKEIVNLIMANMPELK